MIQGTSCVSLSGFEIWHHGQKWPQSLVRFWADLMPQAVNKIQTDLWDKDVKILRVFVNVGNFFSSRYQLLESIPSYLSLGSI